MELLLLAYVFCRFPRLSLFMCESSDSFEFLKRGFCKRVVTGPLWPYNGSLGMALLSPY